MSRAGIVGAATRFMFGQIAKDSNANPEDFRPDQWSGGHSGFTIHGGFVVSYQHKECTCTLVPHYVPVWDGGSQTMALVKHLHWFSEGHSLFNSNPTYTRAAGIGVSVGWIAEKKLWSHGVYLAKSHPNVGDDVFAFCGSGGVSITSGKWLKYDEPVHTVSCHVFHGHCVQMVLNSAGEIFAIGAWTEFSKTMQYGELKKSSKIWGVGGVLDIAEVIRLAHDCSMEAKK